MNKTSGRKHLLNILLAAVCLAIVLGCKNSSVSTEPEKTTPTPTAAPTATSKTTAANKLVGTWTGRNANDTGDLRMVFTDDEFTLYANDKMVAAPLKYVVVDDRSFEVTGRDGKTFSMQYSISGDTLNTDMGGTKVKLKKSS